MIPPLVSVVIPVFRGGDQICPCLGALSRQTYAADRYEVIVVDNGENEELSAVVGRHLGVRLAREQQPSSYAARNRGIDIARGEILAFTDADCVPAPDWIENGVAALIANPGCGLVGGRIEPVFRHPENPRPVELCASVLFHRQEQCIIEKRFAITANLFTARRVIEHVGRFDPRLRSGGDKEFGRRVFEAGYGQIYAPEARVLHPVLASYAALYRKVARLLGGELALEDRNYRFARYARDTAKDLVGGPLRAVLLAGSLVPGAGLRTRLGVAAALLLVRYTRAWERTRLFCGAEPRR